MQTIAQCTDLSGKVAVVTGGAVGIGQGITKRLAEAGATVILADISASNLVSARQMLAPLNINIEYWQCDASDEFEIAGIVRHATATFGGIDILVNNAGIYPQSKLSEMTSLLFDKVIRVNLKSVFITTKLVSAHMIARGRGGRIINITSIDALHPSGVGLAHYDASKHAVWGFTKNVALELAPHNIWVNAVAPGSITTPGTQPDGVKNQEQAAELAKHFIERIPARRMGEPDDIAKTVLFLASDLATYMTGSQIVVDGGVLLT